jgi:hypothetical protein
MVQLPDMPWHLHSLLISLVTCCKNGKCSMLKKEVCHKYANFQVASLRGGGTMNADAEGVGCMYASMQYLIRSGSLHSVKADHGRTKLGWAPDPSKSPKSHPQCDCSSAKSPNHRNAILMTAVHLPISAIKTHKSCWIKCRR